MQALKHALFLKPDVFTYDIAFKEYIKLALSTTDQDNFDNKTFGILMCSRDKNQGGISDFKLTFMRKAINFLAIYYSASIKISIEETTKDKNIYF